MADLTHLLDSLKKRNSDNWRPVFFDLQVSTQRADLQKLMQREKSLFVVDNLESQLKELIEIRHPDKLFAEDGISDLIQQHLQGKTLEEYGIWVWYPWSNVLVHILGKEEFIEVRTNRNLYKITEEERDLLGQKSIGVVGLSVGHSIAMTLVQERIVSELRIADFDKLELSNLNRIRTGISNLGLEKVVMVAREIAEIDPYINVRIWGEGLNEGNLDEFFFDGGKLDLIFDECDGIDVKVLIRQQAKKYNIPVVMDTSDAGMIDIERFDLDSERPIFHGLAGELDYEHLKSLKSSEEKIPFVLPIVGVSTMTQRMKASMCEIGETIATWPQLASAVTYGAGISADIARNILLGKNQESGRFFFDPSNQFQKPETSKPGEKPWAKNPFKELTLEKVQEIVEKLDMEPAKFEPDRSDVEQMVEAAILAPSGGNMQPWFWYYSKGNLFLFLDASRSYSMLDFEHRGSYMALGAAVENLRLTAHKMGLNPTINFLPLNGNSQLVATFCFTNSGETTLSKEELSMWNAIGRRQTNRNLRKYKKLSRSSMDVLQAFQDDTDLTLSLTTDLNLIRAVGQIMADGERVRLMHEWSHHDFQNEIRWTEAENRATKNGIDIETVELTESDLAGLKIVSDWETVKELRDIDERKGRKFQELTQKTFRSTSALLFVSAKQAAAQDYLEVGRIAERIWLSGAAMNLAMQPVGAPIFLAHRGMAEQVYSDHQKNTMSRILTELPRLFGVPNHTPMFLLRIHIAEYAKRSLRKPLAQVFSYEGEEWGSSNVSLDLGEKEIKKE